MNNFSHKFKGTHKSFLLVEFKRSCTNYGPFLGPDSSLVQNFVKFYKKYNISEKDLNLIPLISAKRFEELTPDEYTFIVNTPYEFDKNILEYLTNMFDDLNNSQLCVLTDDFELTRIKTKLLPFI